MNLTKEQLTLEYARCLKNTPYALKTYLQTYDNTIQKYVPLELFPDQINLINNYDTYEENIALKYRQAGVTTATAGWASKILAFAKKEKPEKILIIANKLDTAVEMANKIRGFIDQWPKWVNISFTPEKNAARHFKLNNNSEVKAVATSKDALRGYTPTILIFDEAAHIEADDDFWAACMASLSTGGKVIVVSTPNGFDPIYYEIYDQSIRGMNNFKVTEMYWYRDPRYTKDFYLVKTNDIVDYLLHRDEQKDIEIIDMSDTPTVERDFEQMKKYFEEGFKPCSSWFEKMVKKLKFDRRKVAQELGCKFLGSGDNVIESAILENIRENQILEPKHKTMGNALWIWKEPEIGHKYVLGCLPPDEKVLTDNGLKSIVDVDLTDKLINENGELVKIINKQEYSVIDEDVYEVSVDNTYRTTIFTKEHPLLLSKPILKRNYKLNHNEHAFNERYWDFDFNFVKVKDVRVDDWIKVPNTYITKQKINYTEKWLEGICEIRKDFIIDSPLDDNDFWWFIGLWLGDGWLQSRNNSKSIFICFNKKEKYYADKLINIIERIFHRKPVFYEKGQTFYVQFNSKELHCFIKTQFGEYSHGKKISEWVKYIDNDKKINLIKGYFDSDGCWVKIKRKNLISSKISFVSINLELLESIQDILFSLGLISSLNKLRDSGNRFITSNRLSITKECFSLNLAHYDSIKLVKMFNDKEDIKLQKFNVDDFIIINRRIISSCHLSSDNKWIYFRIKNITKSTYTGKVYNFECETNTFMCHHITTHNCDVSRGDSADFSSFQIIDFDTREQVAEYLGKVPPDVMAEICYKWATTYKAYIVVDITGGMGVSTSRKLQELGYKDLYVDGIELGNKWKYDAKTLDKIPGINFNNKRVQIISSFEEALRHEFKVYSSRLLNELNTFIYINGRPDHQKGHHDDLIMAMAIAIYVSEFSFTQLTKVTEHTKTMIESWQVNSNENKQTSQFFNPNVSFGNQTDVYRNNPSRKDYEDNSWLFGKKRN